MRIEILYVVREGFEQGYGRYLTAVGHPTPVWSPYVRDSIGFSIENRDEALRCASRFGGRIVKLKNDLDKSKKSHTRLGSW